MTRVQGTVNGVVKRIYIDRDAAAENRPAWVVEECWPNGSVQETYHCLMVAINGQTHTAGDKKHPLRPTGPAYWLETTAEVVCFLEG